jgi:hypothetical protein
MDQDSLKLIEEAPEPARRQLATMVALQEANRFESTMRQIRRDVGASPQSMEALAEKILAREA